MSSDAVAPVRKPRTAKEPTKRPASTGRRAELSAAFVEPVASDWAAHGEGALQRVREESPAVYARLAAELVPKQVEVGPPSPFDEMNEAELKASIIDMLANDLPTCQALHALAKKRAKAAKPMIETQAQQDRRARLRWTRPQ
jgi:hypothetical protein